MGVNGCLCGVCIMSEAEDVEAYLGGWDGRAESLVFWGLHSFKNEVGVSSIMWLGVRVLRVKIETISIAVWVGQGLFLFLTYILNICCFLFLLEDLAKVGLQIGLFDFQFPDAEFFHLAGLLEPDFLGHCPLHVRIEVEHIEDHRRA